MTIWDNFRLVSGYLRWIDRLPETAIKLGLPFRTAAVLNDSDTPHTQIYWDMIDAFVESIASDSVKFEIETNDGFIHFNSVASMRDYMRSHPDYNIPFKRAFFSLRGKVIAFMDVEYWAFCGGPFPYHDSWTFAIYRNTEDVTLIRDACYRVCEKHGYPVEEELHFLPAPEEMPLWKRFIQWLLK
jgi:hypothetical protein